MSKLSKLLIVGAGVAVANYYTKNSEKLKEHFELLKRKSKDSYGYTRCMIRYTKKNGVAEAANYLYKDAVKVANRAKDSIVDKYNNTVEYGKEISNNVVELKDQASNVKDYSKEVKDNLAVAKVVADELKPKVDSFVEIAKSTVDTIKTQVETIKSEVENDKVQEKIENFASSATKKVEEIKEKVETEVLNKNTNDSTDEK